PSCGRAEPIGRSSRRSSNSLGARAVSSPVCCHSPQTFWPARTTLIGSIQPYWIPMPNFLKLAPRLVVLLVTAVPLVAQQQQAKRSQFVITKGKDTVAVELFSRDGNA